MRLIEGCLERVGLVAADDCDRLVAVGQQLRRLRPAAESGVGALRSPNDSDRNGQAESSAAQLPVLALMAFVMNAARVG